MVFLSPRALLVPRVPEDLLELQVLMGHKVLLAESATLVQWEKR